MLSPARKRPRTFESPGRPRCRRRLTPPRLSSPDGSRQAYHEHEMACTMGVDCELVLLLKAYSKNPDTVLRLLRTTPAAGAVYTAVAYSGHEWEQLTLSRARALFLHDAASVCNVTPALAPLPPRLAAFICGRRGRDSKSNDSDKSRQAREPSRGLPGSLENEGESSSPAGKHASLTVDAIGIDVDVRNYLQNGAAQSSTSMIPCLNALTEALTVAFVVTDGAIIDTVEDHISCFTHSSFCEAVGSILAQPRTTSARVVAASRLIGIYCRAHLTRNVPWTVVFNDEVVSQLFLHHFEYSKPSTSVDPLTFPPSETALEAVCARITSLSFIRHCLVESRHPLTAMGGDAGDDASSALHLLLTRLAWLLMRPGSARILSRNQRCAWMDTSDLILNLHDALKSTTVESASQTEENCVEITICDCGTWQQTKHMALNGMKPCCSSRNRTRLRYPVLEKWIAWELHASLLNRGYGEEEQDFINASCFSVGHGLPERPVKSTDHPGELIHLLREQWSVFSTNQTTIFQAVLKGVFRVRKRSARSGMQTSQIIVPHHVRFIVESVSRFKSFSDVSACLDFAFLFVEQHRRKSNANTSESSILRRPSSSKTCDLFLDATVDEDSAFCQNAVLTALSCLAAPTTCDGTDARALDCCIQSRLDFLHRCEVMLRWLVSPSDQCSYSRDVLRPVASIAALAFCGPPSLYAKDKIPGPSSRRRFPRAWGLVMLARRSETSS